MSPDPIPWQSLRSSLDRLARTGERHMRGCGVPAGRRTRVAAIALYDRQLQLQDRLVTADEFIGSRRGNGFIEAAVEDATCFVAGAENAQLDRIEPEKRRRDRRLQWAIAGAVTLLLLAALLWLLSRGIVPSRDATGHAALSTAADSHGNSPSLDPQARGGTERPDLRAMDKAGRSHAASTLSVVSPERADVSSSQASLAKGGEAAAAKPSREPSSSNGSPSDNASPEEGESEEKGSGQGSRALSDAPGSGSQPKSERQQQVNSMSGNEPDTDSSANQEQAAGANNRSPDSSARSDIRSGSEANQQDGQKSSSTSPGQQSAQKSDRKGDGQGQSSNPGASNNTSQGKGQGSGKDALKKSRGVASMILGVPVPDRVRGLPNPGLVRTTQKKTLPKEEHAAAVDAESRGERQDAIGPVEHPQLRPWQQDLVRDYFSQESSNERQP